MSKWGIAFVVLCLGALVLLQIRADKGYTWEPSFEEVSTDPLGSQAFTAWLRTQVNVTDQITDARLSESLGDVDTSRAIIIITERFDPDAGSRLALERYLRKGGSVLISSNVLSDSMERFLEVRSRSSYVTENIHDVSNPDRELPELPSSFNSPLLPRRAFTWSGDTIGSYDDPAVYGPWEPLVTGYNDVMLLGKRSIGRGEIYLAPNPGLFTNYAVLYDSLWYYTALMVEHFPRRPLVLDHHYKPKKSTQQGLLFTVSQYPALRFSYTTVLVTAVVFVLLGMRRRQRAIPIIDPPINTSIEYARTVAQMFEVGNMNANVAERMADQLARIVRRRTGIRLGVDPPNVEHISQALGVPQDEITALLHDVESIRNGTWDSSKQNFRALHQRITPIIDKGTA